MLEEVGGALHAQAIAHLCSFPSPQSGRPGGVMDEVFAAGRRNMNRWPMILPQLGRVRRSAPRYCINPCQAENHCQFLMWDTTGNPCGAKIKSTGFCRSLSIYGSMWQKCFSSSKKAEKQRNRHSPCGQTTDSGILRLPWYPKMLFWLYKVKKRDRHSPCGRTTGPGGLPTALVTQRGLEPRTFALKGRCSTN